MEKFIAGLAAGAMLGALWVANSNKTRALVQKGQEELKERVDAYIDEKLSQMEQSGQEKKKSFFACRRAARRACKRIYR